MVPETKVYSVYRGLQRPLIFKGLKGKFIYWGMGTVLLGFLSAVILSVAVNYFVGFLSLLAIAFGGLLLITKKQKKGLHSKTPSKGVYIVPAQFKQRRKR